MTNNRTFSELNGAVIRNGNYSIRYVMENDSPRFVAIDVARALNYRCPGTSTNAWCKKYGLGKVVGVDNKLRTYATKEQVDTIILNARKDSSSFRDFWEEEVVPATDKKYAKLKAAADHEKEVRQRLLTMYQRIRKENETLEDQLKKLLREREAIADILGKVS